MEKSKFEAEKSRIIQNLIELCEKTIWNLEQAVIAAKQKDKALSEEIWRTNEETRISGAQTDELSAYFLAMEHPVAKDLRDIIVVLKTMDSFERINRHACSLASMPFTFKTNLLADIISLYENMVSKEVKMLQAVLEAFKHGNLAGLSFISEQDDAIDELYKTLKKKIIEKMKSDISYIEDGAAALSLARFLERVGDHVTDIAEWAYYGSKGLHTQFNN